MGKKRQQYSSEYKAKVVLEVLSGQRTLSEACRAHKLHTSVLSRWKNEFVQQAHRAFEGGQASGEEAARVADLERMVGRLTLELEVAKKASSQWHLSGNETW